MRTLVLAEYDSRWPAWFGQIRATLWPAVQDLALTIEHVGSTAVVGLDIVIASADLLPQVIDRLVPLGYTHLGDPAAVTAARAAFIAGAVGRGVPEATADAVFAQLTAFGGYAFPRWAWAPPARRGSWTHVMPVRSLE